MPHPKPIHRVCSHRECGRQFLCYGECQNPKKIEEKSFCFCPACARREGRWFYNNDTYCESRFGSKAVSKICRENKK